MSLSNGKLSFSINGTNMSNYIQSAYITYDQARTMFGLEPVEPAKLSDCPHKPGTPDHREWVRVHVLQPQSDSRTEAALQERARIQGLTQDRRVQMDTDRARRTAELDALIADLPEPNVPIPPDPASYLDGITRVPLIDDARWAKADFTNITEA